MKQPALPLNRPFLAELGLSIQEESSHSRKTADASGHRAARSALALTEDPTVVGRNAGAICPGPIRRARRASDRYRSTVSLFDNTASMTVAPVLDAIKTKFNIPGPADVQPPSGF